MLLNRKKKIRWEISKEPKIYTGFGTIVKRPTDRTTNYYPDDKLGSMHGYKILVSNHRSDSWIVFRPSILKTSTSSCCYICNNFKSDNALEPTPSQSVETYYIYNETEIKTHIHDYVKQAFKRVEKQMIGRRRRQNSYETFEMWIKFRSNVFDITFVNYNYRASTVNNVSKMSFDLHVTRLHSLEWAANCVFQCDQALSIRKSWFVLNLSFDTMQLEAVHLCIRTMSSILEWATKRPEVV